MKSVVHALIIFVHSGIFDLPSPFEDANMIACSVVGARLDYANAVLYGVSKKNISRLQRIQNALARCVVDSKLHLNSNASLQHLHWLPVDYRIKFKIAKFAFLASTSATSSYLNSLIARN